jgi:hypothetical protein
MLVHLYCAPLPRLQGGACGARSGQEKNGNSFSDSPESSIGRPRLSPAKKEKAKRMFDSPPFQFVSQDHLHFEL